MIQLHKMIEKLVEEDLGNSDSDDWKDCFITDRYEYYKDLTDKDVRDIYFETFKPLDK